MTTNTFMAAFKRFTSRRGGCTDIYSDNGTNFVGAQKLFQKEIKKIEQEENVQEKMATDGVRWHYIPPGAPNHGGYGKQE